MAKFKIHRPAVRSLRASTIHAGSIGIDWGAAGGANGDGFTAYGAEACEDCGALVVLMVGQGGESHRQIDGSDCDGYLPTFDGPMMNYYYPLLDANGIEPLDAAKQIAHLPLCLVEWGEEGDREGYALALTGGGMDLSWEICEAFMCLGYCPPIKYAGRLPNMAGLGGPVVRYVLAGARRSISVARAWLDNDARHVRHVASSIRSTRKAVQA